MPRSWSALDPGRWAEDMISIAAAFWNHADTDWRRVAQPAGTEPSGHRACHAGQWHLQTELAGRDVVLIVIYKHTYSRSRMALSPKRLDYTFFRHRSCNQVTRKETSHHATICADRLFQLGEDDPIHARQFLFSRLSRQGNCGYRRPVIGWNSDDRGRISMRSIEVHQ